VTPRAAPASSAGAAHAGGIPLRLGVRAVHAADDWMIHTRATPCRGVPARTQSDTNGMVVVAHPVHECSAGSCVVCVTTGTVGGALLAHKLAAFGLVARLTQRHPSVSSTRRGSG
jgi:hypothetical protein